MRTFPLPKKISDKSSFFGKPFENVGHLNRSRMCTASVDEAGNGFQAS